jgi:hypothetical protein
MDWIDVAKDRESKKYAFFSIGTERESSPPYCGKLPTLKETQPG